MSKVSEEKELRRVDGAGERDGVCASQVRRWALEQPGAEEQPTWGHPTFRVGGHIFVGLDDAHGRATVRTTPAGQADLIAADPGTFAIAPRVGRFGWVSVDLATVDAEELRELVEAAWRLAAPRRVVADRDRAGKA